jgi:trigger factor
MSKLKEFTSKHLGIFSIQFCVVVVLLISCIVALAMCSTQDDAEVLQDQEPTPEPINGGTVHEPDPDDWEFTTDEVTNDNINQFVTVGQFKGIEFDRVTVDDQDVEDFITQHLAEGTIMADVTDRAAQDGDLVIIDYIGSIDGVPFEFGADSGAELLLGSGMFIPGFEEQIVGHNVGDVFDINVTFPETYHAEELAGEDAVFEITLHVIREERAAELNEDFVRELGLESVAEYRTIVRERLEDEAKNNERRQVFSEVLNTVVFHKIPISEVEQREVMTMEQFIYEAEFYNIELEEMVAIMTDGLSIQEFLDFQVRPHVVGDVQMDLVIRSIAAQEGITITQTEVSEEIDRIVREIDFYESVEHFMRFNTITTVMVSMLADRVIEVLMDNAVPR